MLLTLAIIVSGSIVDSSPLTGLDEIKFAISCLPLAIVLTVPLAISSAWIINRQLFYNRGEWQSLLIYGLRFKRALIIVFFIAISLIFSVGKFANTYKISNYQQKLLQQSSNIVSNSIIKHKDQIIKSKANGIEIISKKNHTIKYEIFNKGSGQADISLTVDKNQALGFEASEWQLINLDFPAITCLLILMLVWAAFVPSKKSNWPLLFGLLSCVLLFVINVNLMKWLGKHDLFSGLGAGLQIMLFLLVGNLNDI